MAIMMRNLYEALVEGGASSDTARKAAEEVADYPKQPGEIGTDLTLVKGLLAVSVAGTIALVIKGFFL